MAYLGERPFQAILWCSTIRQMIAAKRKIEFLLLILAGIAFQDMGAQNYTISGYVEDLQTGERLIGSYIADSVSEKVTQSNSYGFFSIKLTQGRHTISATYVGYKGETYRISLLHDTTFIIKLGAVNELQEVVVKASVYNRQANTPLGMVLIPIKQLTTIPALGETDVLKAIQQQPGIQGGIEGSAGIFVRGGGAGENLFIIDDVPVYNVSHLYGFLSTFNSSAVKDIKVLKGCFPASYGGRVSSVIDVRTRDGNNQAYTGEVSVGLISSKLMFEGPLGNPNTTFMVSGRRSYLDLFTNLMKKSGWMDENFPKYYFYDLNAKLVHTFSIRDRLYLSFYNGKDHIQNLNETLEVSGKDAKFAESNTETSGWGNMIGSLRWNHSFGGNLFFNTTIAYSRYNYFAARDYNSEEQDLSMNTSITREYHTNYTSQIYDLTGKTDFSYSVTSRQALKFGAGNTFHTFNPGINQYVYNDELLEESMDTSYTNATIEANEFYLYAGYTLIPGRTTIDLGVRASGFIAGNDKYFIPQPRIALNYMVLPNLAIKAGYSRMEQYIHLLSNSGLSMPTDIWIPATNQVKPLLSDQINAGITCMWRSIVTVSAEVYQKWLNNTTNYRNGASLSTDLRPWYEKVTQGEGRAKGLEIVVEKPQGKVSGSISYTLSKADRIYPEINHGKVFPFQYDRRHHFNIYINCVLSEKWDVSVAWVYGTGYPATLAVEKYLPGLGLYNVDSEYGGEIDYYPAPNNARMTAYHRLDAGLHYKVKNRIGEHMISLDIFNVYNRKNPVYMYFSGYRAKTIAYENLLPIIPTITYTLKF
jgi:outer membrane cobalamin receptor